MKEFVNASHDIRHFDHSEASHNQIFGASEQVEYFEVNFFPPSHIALLILL